MLFEGFVHGDLSPFNLLYWQGEITIIDLPQTANPWNNPDALELLIRDVSSICDYFTQQGARNAPTDAERVARGMWQRMRGGKGRREETNAERLRGW